MDTLYQLLEWNPVQVGSTFQGGDRGGTGRPWEPVQAASGKLKFEDVSSEMQKKCEKKRKTSEKRAKKTKTKKSKKSAKTMRRKCGGVDLPKLKCKKKAK